MIVDSCRRLENVSPEETHLSSTHHAKADRVQGSVPLVRHRSTFAPAIPEWLAWKRRLGALNERDEL